MDPRDPNYKTLVQRKTHLTPLMDAKARAKGAVVNFCPFGCEDHDLDENGYCGHLIGFLNQGQRYYEPRAVRKRDGRIIVDGFKKQPMQKGFRLVWITTTARVYSPDLSAKLQVKTTDLMDKAQAEVADKERRLQEAADELRNPTRRDGEWEDCGYDPVPATAPAP